MYIPLEQEDIIVHPLDPHEWPKHDHELCLDFYRLPPGLLCYKSAALRYGGLVKNGVLCLVVSEVHQCLYTRFLDLRDNEKPGEKNTAKEPWTLIHPVMGLTWIQASCLLRRTPDVQIDGQLPTFIALVDNPKAYLELHNLGECSMDGIYTSPAHPDIILAFNTHRFLGTTAKASLRDTMIDYDPPIHVYPPCPVDPALLKASRTFLEEGKDHKFQNNLMPMKSWLSSLFKPWVYSKCTVKPRTAMAEQMGNVTMMSKEEWGHFVHYKTAEDPREVEMSFFQPIFAERPVLSSEEERAAVSSANFKSVDVEAEKASLRAQAEIERLAAMGWPIEIEGPIFFD